MSELTAGDRMRPPTHPGELMREIIEEHVGLSVTDAARRMGGSLARIEPVTVKRAA